MAGIHKGLEQIGKTMVRLLLEKQSYLCLHCLYRPFWQATSVQNFRTYIDKDLLVSVSGVIGWPFPWGRL